MHRIREGFLVIHLECVLLWSSYTYITLEEIQLKIWRATNRCGSSQHCLHWISPTCILLHLIRYYCMILTSRHIAHSLLQSLSEYPGAQLQAQEELFSVPPFWHTRVQIPLHSTATSETHTWRTSTWKYQQSYSLASIPEHFWTMIVPLLVLSYLHRDNNNSKHNNVFIKVNKLLMCDCVSKGPI